MQRRHPPNKFAGRRLVIATKHKKEDVISPLFTNELGVVCFTPTNFDTDLFGTFTGEKLRLDDPMETVRKKCIRAMELTNCDMGIASEGSFGPHPTLALLNCDDELMMFIDRANNLEICVRELSLYTNFNGQAISNEKELIEFAYRAKFPQHALILKRSKEDAEQVVKGISNWKSLKSIFSRFHHQLGSVYIETDMRAMHNPTRMQVISNAAEKLLKKVTSCCPACAKPGFGITKSKPGLPCELCGFPTRSTLSVEYTCEACEFTQEKLYPHGKECEEPMYCDFCNP